MLRVVLFGAALVCGAVAVVCRVLWCWCMHGVVHNVLGCLISYAGNISFLIALPPMVTLYSPSSPTSHLFVPVTNIPRIPATAGSRTDLGKELRMADVHWRQQQAATPPALLETALGTPRKSQKKPWDRSPEAALFRSACLSARSDIPPELGPKAASQCFVSGRL